MENKLKYFVMAKEYNESYKSLLNDNEFHFRGNFNSMSLVSVKKNKPELGIPGIKSREKANALIKNIENIDLGESGRPTPEKKLQSWIIKYALNNDYILPFGENLEFITSELVLKYKDEYKLLKSQRDIRNDILAIDDNKNLVIIELKSKRLNEVKQQTIEFEKVINNEKQLFSALVSELTNMNWSGKCIKIAVWPDLQNHTSQTRKNEKYNDVIEICYTETDDHYIFRNT